MIRLLLILALLVVSVHAEEAPKTGDTKSDQSERKRPPRNLRILPVGESPPYRQEIRDGVRYELPPPPGSVPPMEVSFVASETEKARKYRSSTTHTQDAKLTSRARTRRASW